MSRLHVWCVSLLALLPFLASAETVPINATAQGSINSTSITLGQLVGYENVPPQSVDLPFTLTINTQFDTDELGYLEYSSPPTLTSKQFGRPATMTLIVGNYTYSYTGTAGVEAISSDNFYRFGFFFGPGSYDFSLYLNFYPTDGGLGGHPLLSRDLSTDDGLIAGYEFRSYPSNPDAPGSWDSSGPLSHATLNVVSSIPEPGQAGMLLAGMMTLLVARRRQRRFP